MRVPFRLRQATELVRQLFGKDFHLPLIAPSWRTEKCGLDSFRFLDSSAMVRWSG